MQAIRPTQLTDEELLRQVYLMGNEMLPKEWVEELCTRLARQLDSNDSNDKYHEGYEDGFEAGVEHANEEFDEELRDANENK